MTNNMAKRMVKWHFCVTLLPICLSMLILSQKAQAQQEPMYSQYMFNMIHINPAYTGNRATDNFTLLFRKQWVSVEGSPTTASLTWDRRKEESNIGYGLQIYNDQLGIERTTGFQAYYSYRIPFENSQLSFGLSAGVLNYKADYASVSTIESGDAVFQENVNGLLPTVGVGILYGTENWYAGFAIPALLQTKIADGNNKVTGMGNNHYFLNGGYLINMTSYIKLKPSILFKVVNGAPIQTDFNLNAWFNDKIGLGLSYRTKDAIVGMFEIQLSPQFKVGYAYDFLVSNINNYNSFGTHEIMLRYEISSKRNKKILSPRYY